MKINKTLIILSLLLIFCISLGAVSATDTDVSVSNIDDVSNMEVNNENTENNIDVISNVEENGSFTDLKSVINSNNNVILQHNYKYYEGIDDDFKEGIIINKSITIKGNGYTIDCSNVSTVFKVTADNVTIENLTLINCNSTNGGAIYWIGSNGNLLNSQFINCSSIVGGAIYWIGSNGNISNCGFDNCSSSNPGSAIYWDSYYSSIYNCKFDNCSVRYYDGGAIYLNSEGSSAYNCSFINCYSNYRASAIYHGSAVNCSFVNCSSKDNGGAIWDVNVINCSFVNCSASISEKRRGGAMYGGSAVNCSFVNCSAFEGGAMYGGSAVNCSFDNCLSINRGGAIYTNSITTEIFNCSFVDCIVNKSSGSNIYGGGAIYCDCALFNISDCSFVNCAVINGHAFGGAVYIYSGSYNTLNNCVFINCSSTSSGGAIYVSVDYIGLDNCTFINNSANYGGAVDWDGVNGTLSDCNFINNFVSGNGSAVYWAKENGILTDCCFINNGNSTQYVVYWKNITNSYLKSSIFYLNDNQDSSNCVYGFSEDVLINNFNKFLLYNETSIALNKVSVKVNDSVDLIVKIFATDVINGGTVTFNISDGTMGVVDVINSTATYKYYASHAGNLTINLTYSGTTNYSGSSNSFIILVEKHNTTINKINKIQTNTFENITLDVTLNSSIIVNGGLVHFKINGTEIGSANVSNGKASCIYLTTKSGIFTVDVIYDGNDNFINSSNRFTLVVNKSYSSILVNSVNCSVYDNITFNTIITSNKTVNEGKVTFYLIDRDSNVRYNVGSVNVTNGKVIFKYTPIKGGNFYLNAQYDGGDYFDSSNISNTVTVNKFESIMDSRDISFNYSEETQLTVNLKDIGGNNLKNQTIKISLDNNTTQYKYITDNYGNIIINLTRWGNLSSGIHKINCILSSDVYSASPISVNINVNKLKTYIDLSVNSSGLYIRIVAIIYDVNNNLVNNGKVDFIINEIKNSFDVSNGKVHFTQYVHSKGIYNISANFTDNNYESSNNNTSIYVDKLNTTIVASNISSIIRSNSSIPITILDEDGNDVRFSELRVIYENESSTVISIIDNKISILTDDWEFGEHSVLIYYEGTDKYYNSSIRITINIIKRNAFVNLNESVGFINNEITLFTMINDCVDVICNGSVIFYVDGVPIGNPVAVDEGYASITYIANKLGKFNISAVYTGNSFYNPSTNSSTLTVYKNDAQIVGFDMSTTYKEGKSLSLTLIDDYDKFLNGVKVVFKVYKNNVLINTYTATSSNGLVNLPINFGVGNYRVDASIDDWYYKGTNSFNVIVNKAKTTVSLTKSGSYYKSTTLTVKLVDSVSNKPLGSEKVVVKIGSNTVTLTTNANGVATYLIPYKPTTYSVTANASNANIESNVPKLSVKIAKAVSSVITPTTLSTTYDSGKYFQVKVVSKDKKPMVGVKLKLKVYTGKKYKTVTVTTGSNGIAKYSGSKLDIGKHKIVVSSAESTSYMTATAKTSYLTVKKATTTVTAPVVKNKYGKTAYFKVTVKNKATGKVVKSLVIKIKVYTGKKAKTYTVKTNSKGIAQLSTKALAKGTHKVVISSGDSKYTVSKSGNLIVIK